MPLKSSQGLSVSACRTCPYGAVKGGGGSSRFDTEIGGRISDGVQSQATTCWIYSQGTTADHMYVRHTSVFQQTCPCLHRGICPCRTFKLQTTSDAQNILIKGCGSICLESASVKRQTLFIFLIFILKPCYDIIYTNKKELLHSYHSMGLSGIPVCVL